MNKWTRPCLLNLVVLGYTTQVFAGGISLPQIQQNLPRPLIPEAKPIIQVPAETPEPEKKQKAAGIKITVKEFKFTGNKQISSDILAAQLDAFTGHEIGMHELNEAIATIRNYYRQRGYLLTQVYLPTQDLQKASESASVVEMAILEGTLGTVKTEAGKGLDEDYLQSLSQYGLKQGDVLNENNLVRNLMVMNGLPGIQITSQLNPGEAVGSSDVVVSAEPKVPFSGSVYGNNYGNPYTGREIVGFATAFNNLRGRGDQLDVVGRVSRDEGQRSIGALYFTPVGDAGNILNLAYTYVDYKIGRNFKSLDAHGTANYFYASLEHPLIRETRKSVSFKVGTNYKLLDDKVGAFSLDNRRNINSLEFGFTGDWLNQNGSIAYQWGAIATAGNVSFQNGNAKSLDSQNLNTQGGYLKWDLTSTRTQIFDNGLNWILHADYQGANTNLDIAERFGIGSISRWRPFSEIPSQADQGWMVGNDLRKTIVIANAETSKWLQAITPNAFFDIGRGKLNHNPLTGNNHVKADMVGVGVDFQLAGQWVLNTTYARQHREIDGSPNDTIYTVWAQIRKNF